MLNKIIRYSLHNRLVVLVAVSYTHLYETPLKGVVFFILELLKKSSVCLFLIMQHEKYIFYYNNLYLYSVDRM